MCSVGDDDDFGAAELPVEAQTAASRDSKCNKCRQEPPRVVLRAKDRYCRQCFLAGTVHKFKALLGKHKLIRPGDRVLVLHRGGHPSTALLHLIRTGLDLETHKRLRFEPVAVFVENHLHLSTEERMMLLKKVEGEAKSFGIRMYFTSFPAIISNCFDSEISTALDNCIVLNPESLNLSDDDKYTVTALLDSQKSKTSKFDFMRIMMLKTVIAIAKHLGCKFAFSPEISMDIAAQLLTNISLGRGSQVPLDTGFCDSRDPDVKILHPLRLFDTKEVVFYNHFNDLHPVSIPQPKAENPTSSIQSLMKRFVRDLQINYPATVTTILKTGDKLGITANSTDAKCSFCSAPIDIKEESLSSAESTHFSRWVSSQALASGIPQEWYIENTQRFDQSGDENLCFACEKLTLSESEFS